MKPGVHIPVILCCAAAAVLLAGSCVEQYVSPYKSPTTGYLVVEGYIAGNGPTRYTLSRSISLQGDSAIPAVTGAALQVEGDDNSTYPLTEQGNGVYGAPSLPLNAPTRYRLRIATPGGDTYLSDFVPYRPTPPIDSINWVRDSRGVTIYANTHDPTNSTRYYQWTYDQVWEYHSAEGSQYIYDAPTNSLITRPDSEMFYTCYRDVSYTSILIGSSAKLAQDLIYEAPLVHIGAATQPLSVEYTILVNQYALTDSAYNFLQLMKQNTESLGSIFDAQPSNIQGNIRSVTNPGEPVIGYISAGTLQQQRIFINNSELKDWGYVFACTFPDVAVPDNPDSIKAFFGELGLIPTYQIFKGQPPMIYYDGNLASCIDCRTQAGTTQKPPYWPN
jgi:hypothetical protein